MSLYKKTPHPSRFARHLLPLSRRRRPRSLSRIGQFPAGEGFLSAFSFAHAGAKEKAIKKKTPKEDFALCGALTQSRRRRHTRSAYVSIPTAVGGRHRLLRKRRAKTTVWRAKTLWCAKNFREKVARSDIHLLRRASRTSS